jgi:hypothetical protein
MVSPLEDRLPMGNRPIARTVAAMILAFVYRCGGSDGIACSTDQAHRLPVSSLD